MIYLEVRESNSTRLHPIKYQLYKAMWKCGNSGNKSTWERASATSGTKLNAMAWLIANLSLTTRCASSSSGGWLMAFNRSKSCHLSMRPCELLMPGMRMLIVLKRREMLWKGFFLIFLVAPGTVYLLDRRHGSVSKWEGDMFSRIRNTGQLSWNLSGSSRAHLPSPGKSMSAGDYLIYLNACASSCKKNRRSCQLCGCNCDQNSYTWLQLDLVGKGYNEAMCRYWPLGFDTQGTERSLPGVALHSGPTKTSGPSLHPSWVHEKAAASSKWRWVCCCRGATSSEVKSSCQPMPCYLANRSTFLYCNQFTCLDRSRKELMPHGKKMPNMLPHNTYSWKHCKHCNHWSSSTRQGRQGLHLCTIWPKISWANRQDFTDWETRGNTWDTHEENWGNWCGSCCSRVIKSNTHHQNIQNDSEWSKCGFGLHRGDATSAGRMARQSGEKKEYQGVRPGYDRRVPVDFVISHLQWGLYCRESKTPNTVTTKL